MLRKAISLISISLVLAAGSSLADELVVDGISGDSVAGRPARGATQDSVQTEWGEPRSRRGPVGEPPISRWEYEPFYVYFEDGRVVHSVEKR